MKLCLLFIHLPEDWMIVHTLRNLKLVQRVKYGLVPSEKCKRRWQYSVLNVYYTTVYRNIR